MRVKKESEKAGIKLNIPKANSMASSTITSWQIDGKKSRNSGRFYFLGLQIIFGKKKYFWLCMVTAAMKIKDTCSLEEKL